MTGVVAPRTGHVGPRTDLHFLPRRFRPVLFDTTQLALERAIEGAGKRHQALAANLANANTPGYRRVDVDFHSTLSAALGRGAGAREALHDASFAPKVAANALEHQAAVQVAHARIGILKAAMGTGL